MDHRNFSAVLIVNRPQTAEPITEKLKGIGNLKAAPNPNSTTKHGFCKALSKAAFEL
jgi:hypothetical protein